MAYGALQILAVWSHCSSLSLIDSNDEVNRIRYTFDTHRALSSHCGTGSSMRARIRNANANIVLDWHAINKLGRIRSESNHRNKKYHLLFFFWKFGPEKDWWGRFAHSREFLPAWQAKNSKQCHDSAIISRTHNNEISKMSKASKWYHWCASSHRSPSWWI